MAKTSSSPKSNRRSTPFWPRSNNHKDGADSASVDSTSIYTSCVSTTSRTNLGTSTSNHKDGPEESDVESTVLQRSLQAHVDRVFSERKNRPMSTDEDNNNNNANHITATYSDEENDNGDYELEMMDSVPPQMPSTPISAHRHRRAQVIAQSQHRRLGRLFVYDKRFKSARMICLIAVALVVVILAGAIAMVVLRNNNYNDPTTNGQQDPRLAPTASVVATPPTIAAVTKTPSVAPVLVAVTVTKAPVSTAPASQAPVSKAPITKAPVSKAPVSKAPVSKAPISKAPVSKAPVSKAPVSKAPVSKAPVTASPSSTPRAATPVTVTKAPVTAPVNVTSLPGSQVTESSPTVATAGTTVKESSPTAATAGATTKAPVAATTGNANTRVVRTDGPPCADDSEETFLVSGPSKRNCGWLKTNPVAKSNQCEIQAIKDLCRKTCGVCV